MGRIRLAGGNEGFQDRPLPTRIIIPVRGMDAVRPFLPGLERELQGTVCVTQLDAGRRKILVEGNEPSVNADHTVGPTTTVRDLQAWKGRLGAAVPVVGVDFGGSSS